jgi:hypothetical protein
MHNRMSDRSKMTFRQLVLRKLLEMRKKIRQYLCFLQKIIVVEMKYSSCCRNPERHHVSRAISSCEL